MARAKELGMRLGLWAAWSIPLNDMVWNWENLGQEQFKLDFASLNSQAAIDGLRTKAREFIKANGHRCMISWGTTETAPRYGYYLFREYGNVHFMNRKPEQPGNVLYVQWLALRDFWQLVIRNPEVVMKEVKDAEGKIYTSDAWKHGVDYSVATALMGTPEFMAVTRF